MQKHLRSKLLLAALAVASAPACFSAPALPVNPGLLDATRPAAPRAEVLSLPVLKDRLRGTNAISALKKLALKSEIDDLLERFRAAHAGGTLEGAALREPYERLMAKIQVHLRKDPQLARDMVASREAIWGVLADQTKFASLN